MVDRIYTGNEEWGEQRAPEKQKVVIGEERRAEIKSRDGVEQGVEKGEKCESYYR